MTTITRRTTGFFDLPLELRQMVYDDSMPKHSFDIGASLSSDDDQSLCDAHPRLALEMREWQSEHCREAVFRIRSTMWRAPAHFHLDRLQRLTIILFHYDHDNVVPQLDIIRTNMQLVVDWVNSRKGILPLINVMFEDLGGAFRHSSGTICAQPGVSKAEQYWYRSFLEDRTSCSTVLRTIDSTRHSRSIFEYLLEPLVEMSKSRRLDITLLKSVCDRDAFSGGYMHVPTRYQHLDRDYMRTFAETLEAWAEGRIAKNKPFRKRWRKYLSAVRLNVIAQIDEMESDELWEAIHDKRYRTKRLLTNVEKPAWTGEGPCPSSYDSTAVMIEEGAQPFIYTDPSHLGPPTQTSVQSILDSLILHALT